MLGDEDRKGVDVARNAIVRAILNGDPKAYSLSFTEDGIVMHPDSAYVKGRKALETYAAQLFAAIKITQLEMKPVVVAGDERYAYEVGTQFVAVEPANEKFKSERQYIHAYEKGSDGIWRIAAGMSGNA